MQGVMQGSTISALQCVSREHLVYPFFPFSSACFSPALCMTVFVLSVATPILRCLTCIGKVFVEEVKDFILNFRR